MSEHCVTAYVYGVVQGVGFRYHAQQPARQLGVKGDARNCEDGSVEVVASGEPQQVEQLIIWLKGGDRAVLVLSAFLSSPAR